MPQIIQRPSKQQAIARRVTPSVVDPASAAPFTLDQELVPFGAWVGNPVWVPPKDASKTLAETMLHESRMFASKQSRWQTVVNKHRHDFTQVREFDLFEASIRLPRGKFFVTVTEQQDFDKITDTIPACVQTRLDEFLAGPGKQTGAKVYYLKPLCVEIGDDLIMSTRDDLTAAIEQVQDEVFAEYQRRAVFRRPLQAITKAVNLGLAVPQGLMQRAIARRQRAVDAYHARLEFNRRKLALRATRTHQQCRSHGCTFDEMLSLTTPLDRRDVIVQYCAEQELSRARRDQLLRLAAGSIPWFMALSLTVSYVSAMTMVVSTPPIIVCDPAFVAELPDRPGVLLKIGHFDEVAGVMHVEL